jgi:hypothetical protein
MTIDQLQQQISVLKQQLEATTGYALSLEETICLNLGYTVEDLRSQCEVVLYDENGKAL